MSAPQAAAAPAPAPPPEAAAAAADVVAAAPPAVLSERITPLYMLNLGGAQAFSQDSIGPLIVEHPRATAPQDAALRRGDAKDPRLLTPAFEAQLGVLRDWRSALDVTAVAPEPPVMEPASRMLWKSEEEQRFQRGTDWLARVPVDEVMDYKAYLAPFRATRGNREDRALEKEEKRRLIEAEEWRRRRLNNFCKSIVIHGDELRRFNKARRSDAGKCARACKAHLEGISHRAEVAEAKASRRRLQALKSNDMESYQKLLEETKNERLKFLLHRTDSYIREITEKVKEQRSSEEKLSQVRHQKASSDKRAAAMATEDGTPRSDDMDDTEDFRGGRPPIAAGEEQDGDDEDPTTEYYRVTHETREEVRQPRMLTGGALKEYQLAGLGWLVSLYNNRLNGILADEMGLGKTIQTIALLAHLIESKANSGPFLVVAPLSTLSNWAHEFAKWTPSMVVLLYKGAPSARKEVQKELLSKNRSYNAVLTTYEYVMRDRAVLKRVEWEYIVVDEGHRMKNAQSKFAQTLGNQYSAQRRLLLTGTPLQNSLPELWALLNFLLPSIFQSVDTFEGWFNKPFASFTSNGAAEQTSEGTALTHEERMLIINRLHEVLRPFVLRRVKANVLGQLPEKVEKVVRSDLSAWQKVLYEQIRSAGAASVASVAPEEEDDDDVKLGGQQGGPRGLNNVLMQLRKCCNHPYLFRTDAYPIDERLISASGKFLLLDSMICKLKAAGHRVLLFSQMTSLIDLLEDFLTLRKLHYLRLDGSTASDERERRMAMFNDLNSPTFMFLLSTRAGGLGLNLATADTVIIFDSDWNPMMDAQAMDRAHRIGQRHEVRVYRLISSSPVEERILARATEKLNVNNLVVEAGKFEAGSQLHERRAMVEELLREYTTTTPTETNGEPAENKEGEFVDEELRISETMATSPEELALYNKVDVERKKNGTILRPLTDAEVPSWVTKQQTSSNGGYGDSVVENGKKQSMEGRGGGRVRKRAEGALSCSDNLSDRDFARMLNGEENTSYKAVGKPGALVVRLKRRRS